MHACTPILSTPSGAAPAAAGAVEEQVATSSVCVSRPGSEPSLHFDCNGFHGSVSSTDGEGASQGEPATRVDLEDTPKGRRSSKPGTSKRRTWQLPVTPRFLLFSLSCSRARQASHERSGEWATGACTR
jgi:hypothetical protein